MFDILVSIVGPALLGAVGWAFVRVEGLSGRVQVLEAEKESLEALINSRFGTMGYRFDSIDSRLIRIERTIDKG